MGMLIESAEINPHTYGQIIYNKRGKNIQWGKDCLFHKWCGDKWTAICKRKQNIFSCHTKINSKWIKDLNVRPETIKLLEENIGRTLFCINHSNILLDLSPKAKETKAKIIK